ncbi:hypothetical protein [Paenibacillus konkukensis]|uniref:hypothetical protein n=1 Tax=Paenibacillus konkukensis TaxID=2020716 RepID=UPI00201DE0AC|nr:hypothetical protein [Paenibacillus konkukensis]
MLLQVGAACHISSYSRYRTAYVKSEYYLSSIQIDLNLRVVEAQGKPTLEVINFYVCVNQRLQSEAVIKDAIIKVLEIYARKLNISEISFIISQSLEKETAFILNANSELPADFSYTLGTASVLFTQNNYKRSPSHYFQEFQTIWHKALG